MTGSQPNFGSPGLPSQNGNGGDFLYFEPFAEHGGAFGDRRAGRNNIINEEDTGPFRRGGRKLFPRFKNVVEVRKPIPPVELGLSGGLFNPPQKRLQCEPYPRRGTANQLPRQLAGLVKPPLAETTRMQRHRHDPPRPFVEPFVTPDFVEHDSEETTQLALSAILESVHEISSHPASAIGTDGKVYRELTVTAIRTAKRDRARRFEALPADPAVVGSNGNEGRLAVAAKKWFTELSLRLQRQITGTAERRIEPPYDRLAHP